MTTPIWFDAHLDLACLAVEKRDMLADDPQAAGGPWQPGCVTLPSLQQGNIRLALATIFTECDGDGPEGYPSGNIERANAVGRAQLEVYRTWADDGHIAIDVPRVLRHDPGIGQTRGGMGVSEIQPPSVESLLAGAAHRAPLHIGILIENADPIPHPDELPWWVERGVVAIGLAWAKPSRYALGNAVDSSDDTGLTDLGRQMISAMDELGVVADLSHISPKGTDEILSMTDRPVIASHSNARGVYDNPHGRSLRDETIIEIARRSGVIGLNLCGAFLANGPEGKRRVSISESIDHVEYICNLVGHRNAVMLGSDMDGGFGIAGLPLGIDHPSDLTLLTDELASRNWSDEDIAGFAHANAVRFFANSEIAVKRTHAKPTGASTE